MDSTRRELLVSLARTAAQLGRADDTEMYYRRILAQDSTDFYANYQLGRLAFQLGNYDQAIQRLLPLTGDSVVNPTVLKLLGDCFSRKEDPSSAAFCYFRAYDVNRENAAVAISLVNTLMLAGEDRMSEALQICDTALYYNPTNRSLKRLKGQGLYRIRAYNEADSIYSALLLEGDSTFFVLKYGGASKYYAGFPMPAIPLLEAAYQRDSSDIEVNLLLGSALGKTYDRQEAFRLLDHAEELMRPKPAIVNQLTLFRAETWAREGRTEEAARLYYALWKAYPDRIGILHALWELYPYDHVDRFENPKIREQGLFVNLLYVRHLVEMEQPPKRLEHFIRLLESIHQDLFFRGENTQSLQAPDGSKSQVSMEEINQLVIRLKSIIS